MQLSFHQTTIHHKYLYNRKYESLYTIPFTQHPKMLAGTKSARINHTHLHLHKSKNITIKLKCKITNVHYLTNVQAKLDDRVFEWHRLHINIRIHNLNEMWSSNQKRCHWQKRLTNGNYSDLSMKCTNNNCKQMHSTKSLSVDWFVFYVEISTSVQERLNADRIKVKHLFLFCISLLHLKKCLIKMNSTHFVEFNSV